MSVGAIGVSTPYAASETAQKPQGVEELTAITINCKKEHAYIHECMQNFIGGFIRGSEDYLQECRLW